MERMRNCSCLLHSGYGSSGLIEQWVFNLCDCLSQQAFKDITDLCLS
jgi:hypothetical protein